MENSEYTKLAEKLGAPGSERFLNVLKGMYSEEECTLLLELFEPATCAEVASRTGKDESLVYTMLEKLVDSGSLTKGKTQYGFHKSVLALHHDVVADPAVMPVPKEITDLWADYFYNEWYEGFFNNYKNMKETQGRGMHRVYPAIGALELSPNLKPEDIIPEEDWKLIITNAKRRIVSPCGCRVSWGAGKCDHLIENTCFANFDNDRGEYYIDKPGRALVEMTLEETLAQVKKLEESGLVHIDACYCCPDSCEIMYSLKKKDRWDLLDSSRYIPVVDKETCTGCQVCIDRCHFDAIEMVKPEGSKKFKACIDVDKCKGCGLCVITCEARAMHMEINKPPEHIPQTAPGYKTPTFAWGFYHLD